MQNYAESNNAEFDDIKYGTFIVIYYLIKIEVLQYKNIKF